MSETANFSAPSSHETAAANWTQDGRLIALETPLGKDRLLLTSMAGEEAISSLFVYELEMLSSDHAISPESLIGRNVKVVITSEDGKTRPIHGMVAQFRAGPLAGRDLRQYNAQVVPWLWYLRHSTDCRIFQNLNVPDIIEQVFKTFGFTDYQLSVALGDYPKLEFCVQYRETALNFVSRLMEEVGIFYFFRHEKDRHVLVIADRNVSFGALPDPQLIYAPASLQSGHVTRWEHTYAFRPSRWSQKDFNFETPSTDLTTTEKTVVKLRSAEAFERFDYPGLYTNKSIGTKLTRTLMEAEEEAASQGRRLHVGRQAAVSRCSVFAAAEPAVSGRDQPQGRRLSGRTCCIIDATLWDAVQQRLADHRANGSERPKGAIPNLLARLLHDEAGDRLVPSHAVKGGKRYRYYISSRLITGSRSDATDGIRVPAAEVESGVIERVRQFLSNGAAVFEALQHLELDVGRVQQLMRQAQEIADTLTNRGRSDMAITLRTLISRIEVQADQISIAIQPRRLLDLLCGPTAVADTVANDMATETAAPLLVTVPLLRRRAGRDTRLLMDGPDATQPDPSLVRVLVRARTCRTKLLQSGEASLTETSRSVGICRSYLTRLARLAFLAPDIVCAILEGRQPTSLTAARLIRITQLPLDWSEQRMALGFG
jgi:hypothetical protein